MSSNDRPDALARANAAASLALLQEILALPPAVGVPPLVARHRQIKPRKQLQSLLSDRSYQHATASVDGAPPIPIHFILLFSKTYLLKMFCAFSMLCSFQLKSKLERITVLVS